MRQLYSDELHTHKQEQPIVKLTFTSIDVETSEREEL